MSRGRSAAYFNWKNTLTGETMPMFMSGMLDLAQRGVITQGLVFGTWKVVKRGSNYGIALA
jgi:hypothetical protein